MKLLVLAMCVCAVTAGSPEDAAAVIVRSDFENTDSGFNYAYETGNGIFGQAKGLIKTAGEQTILTVQGENQWKSPEGDSISLTYTADENGYRVESPVLPTPPPTPEAILRTLQFLKDHPPPVEKY